MRTIITRFGLFAGVLLLQSPVGMGEGLTMSDQVLIVLLNSPAYVIIGWLFWQFLRYQRSENERRAEDEKRRDEHESKLLDLWSTDRQRITAIEEDRKQVEEERKIQTAAWIQAIQNSTQMVSALEARSNFLLQSDKEVSQLQAAIRTEVKLLYDRFMLVFPNDTAIGQRFEDLKQSIIDAVEKTCTERKGDTGEQPAIITPAKVDVTIHTPPPAPDVDATKDNEAA